MYLLTNTLYVVLHSIFSQLHSTPTAPTEYSLPVLQALTGECGFLAANFYACSIFGEDVLANLSIERLPGAVKGTSCRWAYQD